MKCSLFTKPLLPPTWQTVEQPQRPLRGFVLRHFVLESAALLRKRADALVNPLVAVYLIPLRGCQSIIGDDVVYVHLVMVDKPVSFVAFGCFRVACAKYLYKVVLMLLYIQISLIIPTLYYSSPG